MMHLRSPAVMQTSWVSTAVALLLLIFVPTVAAGGLPTMIGMPNCNTTCGNVSVPYPFGMGSPHCYHSPGFMLTCDFRSGKPPRLLLGDGVASTSEVVDISLKNVTMRVIRQGVHSINMSDSGNGISRWDWRLDGDAVGRVLAYVFGWDKNEIILTGCNVEVTLLNRSSSGGFIVSGCASFCSADTNMLTSSGKIVCSNIGCCQSFIPAGPASFSVQLKRFDTGLPKPRKYMFLDDNVVNVLIAEVGWLEDQVDHLRFALGTEAAELKFPVILDWAVPHGAAPTDYRTRACPADAAKTICKSSNSQCSTYYTGYTFRGYTCQCNKGYEGNPYLTGGCQDIKECDRKEENGCFGDCEELPGTFRCHCPKGTHGNPKVRNGCLKPATNTGHHHLRLIIGLSVASGPCVLLLVLGAFLTTRDLKQRKARTLRRKFFSQNRGQLLKQLVSHRADIAERMIISLEEVEKATNNFDRARRLGGGGHGTVYKGILSDLHVVAIKKSRINHKNIEREIEEFINEVAILSQINHKNIVKLHGCCLESEVPLLAYEFISNGTLSDHLHTEAPRSLFWKDRLRITSEISKALTYLHSAISVPIIHRDIKPSNILLDDSLTAKVSDFGASRYILDQAGTTTVVQGTIGYLDPMYFYTRRLTETSDIYSFGVLMVELLTRKRPSLCLSSEGDWLVMKFVELLEDGNLADILDPQVVEEGGSEVEEVATLAVSCIKLVAEERPTMRQVEMALEALQAPKGRGLGDLTEENSKKQYTTPNYPTTSRRAKRGEASRCCSLEEEFMLSARHPR